MSQNLHWYRGVFAQYQNDTYHYPRSDWFEWCKPIISPAIDIGCGKFAHPLAWGIDVAFGHVNADGSKLPLADCSLNTIISSHLIEHVEPILLLTEIRRVIKPGGVLYLEAPNLMGISRYSRVKRAGIRDERYPCHSLSNALLLLRFFGRVQYRTPHYDVPYPGKDPDATWYCNSLAVLRLMGQSWRVTRVKGLMGHTFRIMAYAR